jgi:hypothetical protein
MDLWTIVDVTVRGSGFTIAPDCEQLLRAFVARGEAELKQPWAQERRSEATASLLRFLAEMLDEARRLGLPALHEPTFYGAIQKLCPLWPFC